MGVGMSAILISSTSSRLYDTMGICQIKSISLDKAGGHAEDASAACAAQGDFVVTCLFFPSEPEPAS